MQTFKELTIRRQRVGKMPTLDLNGQWLNEIGFTNGTTVSVSYQDSCLTLCTNPTTTNHFSVLQVTNKLVRNHPRTYLVLDWWLLRKYGFNVGDRVVLHLMPNMIQLTRINSFTTVKVA
jgi:hypothetical protein